MLSALNDGLCLGEALERAAAAPGVDAAEFEGLGDWFKQWTGEGMFAALRLD